MEVRLGYKRTEVGVIPDEWEVKPLGDIFEFSGGFTASREQLSSKGHCYLHYGDIHKSEKTVIDVQAEFLDIPKLDIPLDRVSSRSILNNGAVVFVDASEDDEGTSKHIVVINQPAIPYISGLHTIVAKSKDHSLDNHFKQFCFQTADIKRQFYFYAVGTKVSGISKANIARVLLPIPPIPEQRVIATALGDVDELLAVLTRLIAKKRGLKQAAMQQLLTAQTRLPGFSGEWEIKQLGDLGVTYGGLTGKTKSDFGAGSAQYITFLNIINNVVIDPEKFELVRVQSLESQNQVLKGDLFFNGSSETPEEVGMCSVLLAEVRNVFLNSFCFGFRLHEGAKDNGVFLAYFFRSNEGRELLYSLAQGATRYNLSKISLLKLEFPLPEAGEQTAIAAVLSDMDAEIVALEDRLAKTRALNQGMMQELLTGKTKLVNLSQTEET